MLLKYDLKIKSIVDEYNNIGNITINRLSK